MKKTTFIVILGGILFLGGAGWAYSKWKAYAPATYIKETVDENGIAISTTVNTETGTSTPGAPLFTMLDVAKHKDASSCYSVINGVVYDLTLWINMHPGGKEAILSICGTDGTDKFMAQHKGAQKQMDILARFKIGLLTGSSANSGSQQQTGAIIQDDDSNDE